MITAESYEFLNKKFYQLMQPFLAPVADLKIGDRVTIWCDDENGFEADPDGEATKYAPFGAVVREIDGGIVRVLPDAIEGDRPLEDGEEPTLYSFWRGGVDPEVIGSTADTNGLMSFLMVGDATAAFAEYDAAVVSKLEEADDE